MPVGLELLECLLDVVEKLVGRLALHRGVDNADGVYLQARRII